VDTDDFARLQRVADSVCLGSGNFADCNRNGIPDACDLANPARWEDFESAGNEQYTLNGTASIDAGSARLTEAIQSQLGSVVFEPVTTADVESFTVEFDYLVGGGNGADGLSFALIDADTTGNTVLLGEGGGNQPLVISLDTYMGSPAGGNHALLRSHGNTLAEVLVPHTLDDGQWQHASLTVEAGAATLVLTDSQGNAATIFDAEPVPGYDPVRARYGFGARTGSVTNEHRVDNVYFAVTSQSNDCNANGLPDNCDPDDDADGTPDDCDLCPGFDDAMDADDDGIPDGCDT
jgi:hypothetical protein